MVLEIFTVPEAAAILKVTDDDIDSAIESGDLTAFRIGTSIRLTREGIEEFVRRPFQPKDIQSKNDHSSAADGRVRRTRAGNLEYFYQGAWLSSRLLLETLEKTKHAYVGKHLRAFNTVLRGSGNGLSNLAKDAAKTLQLSSRERP